MRKFSFFQCRFFAAVLVLGVLACLSAQPAGAYPLSEDEVARLKAAIPRTYERLESRQPVHIVMLGDSVSRVFTPDDQPNQTVRGMHARFAMRLANEFFYPGGVRVSNPLDDEPVKSTDTLGAEISLENLSIDGHSAVDAVQRITNDAFLHDPDLVVICYGVNDAVRDMGLGVYAQALEHCINTCHTRGVDVIVLGPNLIRQSPGPTGWGLTRAYATKARELAGAKGVFFVDLGKGLSQRGGIPYKEDAEEGIASYSDRLEAIFNYGPEVTIEDWLHPNHRAHEAMGDRIFDQLMNGEQVDDLRMTARATFDKEDQVAVTLLLRNKSKVKRRGHLAALTMRRQLSPTDPYHSFELEPGQSRTFQLLYTKVPTPGQEGMENPTEFYPLDPQDSRMRFSYLVVDEKDSAIMDVVTPLEPVGVEWVTTQLTDVTNALRLDWRFVNGGANAVNGRYRMDLDGKRVDGQFSLDQGETKRFYAEFAFAPDEGVIRQKIPASITLEVGGRSYTFNREIEATRDLFLGEKVALTTLDDYLATGVGKAELDSGKSGVTLRADADEKALYLTFDFEDIALQKVPNGASLIADLSIDGRSASEVRTFGCIDRVRVITYSEDGYGETSHMRPGFFGNGYSKRVDERYVISTLKTRSDLGRRFSVRIPRPFLFRHEWELGSADSVLGLNTSLSLLAIDPQSGAPTFPGSHRYVLANSGYYYRDARSMITLRLTPEKVPMWSVRVY